MFRTSKPVNPVLGFDQRASNSRHFGNYVTRFFNLVLALFVSLFFGLMAALFAISLVVAGLIYLAFASVRFLVTGRKPAVAVMFTQLRQFQRSAADGVWPAARRAQQPQRAPERDVVDVDVREVEVNRTETAGAAPTDREAR